MSAISATAFKSLRSCSVSAGIGRSTLGRLIPLPPRKLTDPRDGWSIQVEVFRSPGDDLCTLLYLSVTD